MNKSFHEIFAQWNKSKKNYFHRKKGLGDNWLTNVKKTAYHRKIINQKSQPIGAKAQIINPYPKEFVTAHT